MRGDPIEPGTRVNLKANAKRYYGGQAWVITYAPHGRRLMYLVERLGTVKGAGQNWVWVSRGEFEVLDMEAQEMAG